jgi:hypothetical protein
VARATRKAHAATLAFDALTVEGALIAPAMLSRIAEQKSRRAGGFRLQHSQGLDLARRNRALLPHRPGAVYRALRRRHTFRSRDDAVCRGASA